MKKFTILLLTLISAGIYACRSESVLQDNVLSAQEKSEGWQLLFNGRNLDHWHTFNAKDKTSKWEVENGILICNPKKNDGIFADLVSDENFENFELQFDWKVSKGGNSGVFIDVQESPKYAATFATGLEMQLLDNANAEPRHQSDSTHWSGCLYAVECLSSNSKPRSFGHWNNSKIIQSNNKVSFWLNGNLTFESNILDEAWKEKIAKSNMKVYPDFGKFGKGKIALQNHTDSVQFKNIKIKKL